MKDACVDKLWVVLVTTRKGEFGRSVVWICHFASIRFARIPKSSGGTFCSHKVTESLHLCDNNYYDIIIDIAKDAVVNMCFHISIQDKAIACFVLLGLGVCICTWLTQHRGTCEASPSIISSRGYPA